MLWGHSSLVLISNRQFCEKEKESSKLALFLTFLLLQRQELYYFFNLIMPCALITGISLLVFCLPPETGEKISLEITVLLSLCVFLLMMSERMPATSETIPLIGT